MIAEGPPERAARTICARLFQLGYETAIADHSRPDGRIVPPPRDRVAVIGAALDAAKNDPAELAQVREQYGLHPYSPVCTPECRRGAWI